MLSIFFLSLLNVKTFVRVTRTYLRLATGSPALNCTSMNPTTLLLHNSRLSLEIVTDGENCAALETGFPSFFFPFYITSLNEMLHFRG